MTRFDPPIRAIWAGNLVLLYATTDEGGAFISDDNGFRWVLLRTLLPRD